MFKKAWWMVWVMVWCLQVTCWADEALQPPNMANNEFAITFPANPTTGYTWSIVAYDQRLLVLRKSEYMTPDNTKLIGAAGKMLYEFELSRAVTYPLRTVITFRYARPWDEKNGIIKHAVISAKKPQHKPLVQIQ